MSRPVYEIYEIEIFKPTQAQKQLIAMEITWYPQ